MCVLLPCGVEYSAVCVEKVEKEKVLFGLQVRVQQLQLQLEEEQHLVQVSSVVRV